MSICGSTVSSSTGSGIGTDGMGTGTGMHGSAFSFEGTGAAMKATQKVLLEALAALRRKDRSQFFWQPVDGTVVQDYYSIVSRPMDFATMEMKITAGDYAKFESFEGDIMLIVANCKTYNSPTTVYVKNALQLEVWWSRNRKKYANSFQNILTKATDAAPSDHSTQASGKHISHSLPPVQRAGSYVGCVSAAGSRTSSVSTDEAVAFSPTPVTTRSNIIGSSSSSAIGSSAVPDILHRSADNPHGGYAVSGTGGSTGGIYDNYAPVPGMSMNNAGGGSRLTDHNQVASLGGGPAQVVSQNYVQQQQQVYNGHAGAQQHVYSARGFHQSSGGGGVVGGSDLHTGAPPMQHAAVTPQMLSNMQFDHQQKQHMLRQQQLQLQQQHRQPIVLQQILQRHDSIEVLRAELAASLQSYPHIPSGVYASLQDSIFGGLHTKILSLPPTAASVNSSATDVVKEHHSFVNAPNYTV